MRDSCWIDYGFSFATAMGLAYIGSTISDMFLVPLELFRRLATAHPWPITARTTDFIVGFAIFSSAVFVFGMLYAIVWEFSSTGWNDGIEELWLT